jgi:hypothetical protein
MVLPGRIAVQCFARVPDANQLDSSLNRPIENAMSMSAPPPIPATAPKTWWQRNWIWIAIAGGLLLLLIVGGSTMALLKFVNGQLRGSEPYQIALAAAEFDPAVIEALGSPLTTGSFISGSFNESNLRSDYQLAVPISGPKGKGTLHVVASKVAGDENWSYQKCQVVIAGTNQTIQLRKTKTTPLE